jgi:hypothetical protein
MRWNDPDHLVEEFIADLRSASYATADYTITERILVDEFPVFEDGFIYSGEEYLRGWRWRHGFHQPDKVDYDRFLTDHNLVRRIESGAADEVWMVGFPFGGFYESRMVGSDAFWCNAPPLAGPAGSSRRFVIMGFNYERGVGEMLESYGHRAESIMTHVYRDFPEAANLWKRFTRYDKTHPGQAEVGNIHFAPNSQKDYDWGNRRKVLSNHQAWYKYPDLVFEPYPVDCTEWGNGNIRLHHLWWYRHLPHVPGERDQISNNWWEYIVNPDMVE